MAGDSSQAARIVASTQTADDVQAPASLVDPVLREAILRELQAAPDGVSLPRLIKRLKVRMSVLMRALAWLGDEAIGAKRGEGLVCVEQRGETQVARLTEAARATPLPTLLNASDKG